MNAERQSVGDSHPGGKWKGDACFEPGISKRIVVHVKRQGAVQQYDGIGVVWGDHCSIRIARPQKDER